MYLVDTDVISEVRKRGKANQGVTKFFRQAAKDEAALYLSAITVGELRRGVELIRHRGDVAQAELLDTWLHTILSEYHDNILPLDAEVAQVWGRLRVPHPENAFDKQIAATALIHDLTLVTRNEKHFAATGAKLLNPFQPS
jgi:predicted nucleic acid-binding protein